jgi:hypothetical protein
MALTVPATKEGNVSVLCPNNYLEKGKEGGSQDATPN